MSPAAIHAVKNSEVLPAAPATIAGVRKMPIPTTRLNTTMAVSKVDSRARMRPRSRSTATQCFLEQAREFPELIQIVVQLRRDSQQRYGVRMEPRLDAAFAEPSMQTLA